MIAAEGKISKINWEDVSETAYLGEHSINKIKVISFYGFLSNTTVIDNSKKDSIVQKECIKNKETTDKELKIANKDTQNESKKIASKNNLIFKGKTFTTLGHIGVGLRDQMEKKIQKLGGKLIKRPKKIQNYFILNNNFEDTPNMALTALGWEARTKVCQFFFDSIFFHTFF